MHTAASGWGWIGASWLLLLTIWTKSSKPSGTEIPEALSFTSLTKPPFLLMRGQSPFTTGVAGYADFDPEDPSPNQEPRIWVRVVAGSSTNPVLAVVDTAAPWCIFRPAVANLFARNLEPIPGGTVLSTRFGRVRGILFRGLITLLANGGEPLDVDSTIFISPDWQGPNFLGYQGLLQRIRFAIDPETSLFYFGQI